MLALIPIRFGGFPVFCQRSPQENRWYERASEVKLVYVESEGGLRVQL